MTATNKLGLELLQNAAANQTLANTTFALLNQLVQAGVVDKDLAAPPSSPSDESLYIVGASATGAWAGRDGQLAYWLVTAGAWQFITPKEGFFLHVNDEDVFYKFTGTAWEVFSGGGGGGGMANPMTSIRDLIVGGTGGAPTRLPGPASEGMVLTRIGNALGWAPGGGDFKKDGSTQMTGPFNQAPVVEYPQTDSVLDWSQVNSDAASSPPSVTGISAMAGAPAGARRLVKFGEGHKLYHIEGTLELPGKADISTRSGDSAEFLYRGNNRWQCVWYTRADGTALVASAGFTEDQVRKTPLTGLSTSASGQIAAADTVLAALGKLQAQLNGSVFRMETIATSTVGQTSYAVPNGYTAGQIQVWFNGVLLQPSEYTATDGANVVLQTGAISTSDVMQVGVLGSLRTQDDALLQYTVANLPSASANAFKQRWCTNMAGGAGVVVSNGTNWVRVADNTTVTV